MKPIAVFALALLVAPIAAAQEPPAYRDDRSSGTAVIQSLYNAINRQEYLRAWSYFDSAAEDPTADYEAFKKGYAETASVTLLTGPESSEGAAGSTYYTVPAAIDAMDSSGRHKSYAGCYTLRLAQPTIQDAPPFHPLHIVKGDLHEAEGALTDILPASCEQ